MSSHSTSTAAACTATSSSTARTATGAPSRSHALPFLCSNTSRVPRPRAAVSAKRAGDGRRGTCSGCNQPGRTQPHRRQPRQANRRPALGKRSLAAHRRGADAGGTRPRANQQPCHAWRRRHGRPRYPPPVSLHALPAEWYVRGVFLDARSPIYPDLYHHPHPYGRLAPDAWHRLRGGWRVRLEPPAVSPGLPCSRTRTGCCMLPARRDHAQMPACPRPAHTRPHTHPRHPLCLPLPSRACGCSWSTRGRGTQPPIAPTAVALISFASPRAYARPAVAVGGNRNRLDPHSRHFAPNRAGSLARSE